MPFCRKCGRRLVEYSEKCPQCGTSTTAPLIKIKNSRAHRTFNASFQNEVTKPLIQFEYNISSKVIVPPEPVKVPNGIAPSRVIAKVKAATKPKSIATKPFIPAIVYPKTEIIKSNSSLKDDIITHPQDYETQPFDFDLQCPNNHFWTAGENLVVSDGKAYCPRCGERLRKPKPKRNGRQRFRRF